MKLTKAIEILSKPPTYDNQYLTPDYLNALKLLIEAGKRLQKYRATHVYVEISLLHGETPE